MTAFTSDFPRNWSRTSTHAVIVPSTAFTTETTTATPSVSLSAATDSGADATDQNVPIPPARDAQMSAAIGSTTITERYAVVKPNASDAPASARRFCAGIETTVLARGGPA